MTDRAEAEHVRLAGYQILGVVLADGLHDLDSRLQGIVAAAQGGRFASGDLDLLHSLLPSSLTAALTEHDEAGSVALVRHIALYVHDMALRVAGAGWVLAEQRGVLYPDVEEASDQAWWLANQASVVAAGVRAFHDQSSLGKPAGVARFCTAQAWAETELLTGLDGSEGGQPARSVLILHPDASYLAGVSRGLDAAGVPHVAVTTTDPAQVQAELDGATVAALDEFLWVGSLLETFHLIRHTYPGTDAQARPHLVLRQQCSSASEHPLACFQLPGHRAAVHAGLHKQRIAQALAAHLAAWAGLVGGRFGLVTVDVPALPAGCTFPQAALCPLLDVWRIARGQALVEPAQLLAAAAAAGLLPRPGTGMRFSRAQAALMWTHLIKVPLAVRAAGPTDIPALLRLQDGSLSNLRVAAPAEELAQCVAGAAPRSFVAVYEGAIIAALLARSDTQGGRVALALAAVQGDLEEAPEVAECLLAFLFHYLLADDRITCLSQGALGHCTYQPSPANAEVGERVAAVVHGYVAAAHGSDLALHSQQQPLMEAGLDSLDLLKVASLLGSEFGLALPPTLVFDFPTLESLAMYLASSLQDVGTVDPDIRRRSSFARTFARGRKGSLADVFRRSSVLLGAGRPPAPVAGASGQGAASQRSSHGSHSQRSSGAAVDARRRSVRRTSLALQGSAPAEARGARRSSAYMHGHLAGLPPARHAGSVLLAGNAAATPALQVVVMDAATLRCAALGAGEAQPRWFARDAIAQVPLTRWDTESPSACFPGGAQPARFAGFMHGVQLFDAGMYGVVATEALTMDPQQRLLLEAATQLLHGGVPGLAAPGEHLGGKGPGGRSGGVGVYAGMSYNEYGAMVMAATPFASAFTATGSSLSVAAGRMAYAHGLTGPALVVDTACSSGLVAVAQAHSALLLGQCAAALAAAANLLLSPWTHAAFAAAGMLAPEGRCRTLDAAANGYVRAEAVGGARLRLLSLVAGMELGGTAARPHALLHGAALNQDGRSSSLTAPSGRAQQALLRSALAAANMAPSVAGAAAAVLLKVSEGVAGSRLAMASHKAAVGHAEAAAGVVGLSSAVLALEAGALPPVLHLREVSALVETSLAGAGGRPAVLPRQPCGHMPGTLLGKAVAGVSAFAFQGSNAHVVAEVCADEILALVHALPPVPWHRARAWCVPNPHLLLHAVTVSTSACLFTASVIHPLLAGLRSCRLTGSGCPPAVGLEDCGFQVPPAMLEAALQTSALLVYAERRNQPAGPLAHLAAYHGSPSVSPDWALSGPSGAAAQLQHADSATARLCGMRYAQHACRDDSLVPEMIALRTPSALSACPSSSMRSHGSLLAASSAWAALRVSASKQPALAHAGAQFSTEAAAGRSSTDAAQHGLRQAMVGGVQSEARLLCWRRRSGMRGDATQAAGGLAFLVTGGTGALGTLAAAWLASKGAALLRLLGRTGRCTPCSESLSSLLCDGCTACVYLARADMASSSEAAEASHMPDQPQTLGVVHAGGLLQDATLARQTPAITRAVFAPKHYGAANIERYMWSGALEHCILFSSVAALTGPPGSASYAAANAVLDGHAATSTTQGVLLVSEGCGGRPAVSVQWGAWHGVGMVASSEAVLSRMRRSGASTVSPLTGLAALGAVLHSAGPAQVAAVPFVWKTFLETTMHQPFYAEFLCHTAARQSSSRVKGVERLAAPSSHFEPSSNTSASRHLGLLQLVLGSISTWTGGPVGPNMPLSQAGLDSLGALELRNQLARATGQDLPATLVFDHPTADAIATLLAAPQATKHGDRASTQFLDERPTLDVHMLVLTTVRQLLGADVAADMPLAQAGLDSLGALELRDQLNRSLGIQLPGAAAFDFPTAAALAACCIAQLGCASVPDACLQPILKPRDAPARTQLVSIDGSVQRLPNKGPRGSATGADTVTPTPLERWDLDAFHVSQRPGTRLGRFLDDVDLFDAHSCGITPAEASVLDPQQRIMLEDAYAVLSSRCATKDTKPGIDSTSVVTALSFWDYSLLTTSAGSDALKTTGRCFSVAAGRIAYTYGRGEACVTLALSLRKSEDSSRGGLTLLGSAVNQDGRSSSLTAPHGPSQQQVIQAALADARTPPEAMHCIELHGTGTPLGDPIEVGAIAAALTGTRAAAAPVMLGAAKSHLGHAEPAAGSSALVRSATRMACATQPEILHLAMLNPHIRNALSPQPGMQPGMQPMLCMARQLGCASGQTASRDQGAITGISGFAFQGTNAHVVVTRTPHQCRSLSVGAPCWERRRHWYLPNAHRLWSAIASGLQPLLACFYANLERPAVAEMRQHSVSGRLLLPGAAMFEACHAAAAVLLGDRPPGRHILADSVIQAPMLLSSTGMRPALLLTAAVWASGAMALSPASAWGPKQMTAHSMLLQASPEPASVPGSGSLGKLCQLAEAVLFSGTGTGTGCISTLGLTLDGYSAHPAALDACTHFGALYDTDPMTRGGLSELARVPVALAALVADLAPQGLLSHAMCTSNAGALGTTRVSSFLLLGASGVPAARLHGLTSRLLRSKPTTQSNAGAQSRHSGLLFEQQWHAAQPVVGSMDGHSLENRAHVRHLRLSIRKVQAGSLNPAWVTRAAQLAGVAAGRQKAGTAGAAVWGTLRTVLAEDTRRERPLCDLDPHARSHAWQGGVRMHAVRGGFSAVPRLVAGVLPVPQQRPQQGPPCGSFLVTGGLGSLGLLSARWLLASVGDASALHLVLQGRSGRGAAAAQLAAHCGSLWAVLHLQRGDAASSQESCWGMQARLQVGPTARCTVLHASGVLADALAAKQTITGIRAVFASKVAAASLLARGLACAPLERMLLFSSVSATLGNAGQAAYSGANAALDCAAADLQSQGSACVAVGWGAWAGGGMAGRDMQLLQRLHRQGLEELQPERGLAVLSALLSSCNWAIAMPHWVASPLAADRLMHSRPHLADALSTLPHTDAVTPPEQHLAPHAHELGERKHGAAPPASAAVAADIIAQMAALAAHVMGGPVSTKQPLMEAGLDSLGAVELRNAIASTFGVNLPATAAFDHPTLGHMAAFVVTSRQLQAASTAMERPLLPSTEMAYADVSARLRAVVSTTLKKRVPDDQPLMEPHYSDLRIADASDALIKQSVQQAGLDSLSALDLRNAIAETFLVDLPATAAFDFPSIAALATHILLLKEPLCAAPEQLVSGRRVSLAHVAWDKHRNLTENNLTGLQWTGIPAFWHHLRLGKSVQTDVPLQRWDSDAHHDPAGAMGKAYVRAAAFCQGVDAHDSAYFRHKRAEAVAMDPQTRLLLKATAEAFAISNLTLDAITGWAGATGTYVGCMFTDYGALLRHGYGMGSTAAVMTGVGAPYQGGRLAYTFGLQGPCNGIDTACSSSLVAAHNALLGITHNECRSAVAAGVNLMLWHDVTAGICQLQALSPTGRCQTFDSAADGYGRGEAIVASILHGSSAECAPPGALALACGSAVNQDGRSSSLTAPNGPSQQALVASALASGSLAPLLVAAVMVHGTGTPLGDPIEVSALREALAQSDAPKPPVLASVKACYGHTEGAAGLTGALAAICLASGRKAPAVLCLRELPAPGTSSFGMSGVNAHMLLCTCEPEPHAAANVPALVWEPRRAWPGPYMHRFAKPVATGSNASSARLATDMMAPALAFLWDHRVARRALLAAAAMLEIAVAGSHAMLEGRADRTPILEHVSFSRPVVLGETRSSIAFPAIQCFLDLKSGKLEVYSMDMQPYRFAQCTSACHHVSVASRVGQQQSILRNCVRVHHTSLQPTSALSVLPAARSAGFYLHPAVGDAGLHLGAALAVGEAPVPVTVARCSLKESADAWAGGWSCTASAPGPDAGSLLSRMTWRAGGMQAGGACAAVHGMLSKRASARLTAQTSSTVQTTGLPLYACSWPAALPVTAQCNSSGRMGLLPAQLLSMRNCDVQPVAAAAACLEHLHALPGNRILVFAARSSLAAGQCTLGTLPAGGAALALLRVAASERPDAVLTSLSICLTAAPGAPRAVLSSLAAVAGLAIWDLNASCLYTQRLVPLTQRASQHATAFLSRMSPACGGEAGITGGLGGLGRLAAIWLLQGTEAPPPTLLLSRTGRPSSGQGMAALFGAAPHVKAARCDVSVRSETAVCSARRMEVLLHAGGVLADGLLGRQSLSTLREAFAAKVAGWMGVASRLAQSPVQAAMLFSSIAGLIGSGGQGSYAAANAALDGASRACSDMGQPCTSIQWGAWAGIGLAAGASGLLARLARQGHGALRPADGLAALGAVLGGMPGQLPCQVAASVFKWRTFLKGHRAQQPLFADFALPPEQQPPAKPVAPGPTSGVCVLAVLLGIAADVLGSKIGPDEPLAAAGLDSLGATDLRKVIADRFGTSMPATLVFDFPTVRALAPFVAQRAALAEQAAAPTGQIQGHHLLVAGAETATQVLRITLDVLADLLGSVIQPDTPLMEAGMDSLGAVQLRAALGARFGLSLPPTVMFDFPTAAALAAAVGALLGVVPHDSAMLPKLAPGTALGTALHAAVHVVDVSSGYPQGGFDDGLLAGANLVTNAPAQRWDTDWLFDPRGLPGKTATRFGAFLAGIESFDAKCFQLAGAEAANLDPHARLLLEHAQEVLAPHALGELKGTSVGVYIGCMWASDFVGVLPMLGVSDTASGASIGNTAPFLVGRVSYTFALTGPCISTDTACSSSLVAAHLARSGLRNEECMSAVAAGASLMLSAKTHVKISQLQALSPVGRCKTFDEAADGYGRGEAVAVLLLSTLPGSHGIAVLQASAVNQDGRSSGLTAPNGPAQTAVVRAAMAAASTLAQHVSAVAVHGTGTALGDPIEVGALGAALCSKQGAKGPLALTPVKACFGHTEGAAGMSGIQMAVLSLSAHAPSQLLRVVNPYVSAALGEWLRPAVLPRQHARGCSTDDSAGTSSFGMSGVNAHALLCVEHHIVEVHKPLFSWHRTLCWPAPTFSPLLEQCMCKDRAASQLQFIVALTAPSQAYMRDHRVQGHALLPASAFLEIAVAAARSSLAPAAHVQLASSNITAPLQLPPTAAHSTAEEVAISVVVHGTEITVGSYKEADNGTTATARAHMNCVVQALRESVADLTGIAEPRKPLLVPCQPARAYMQSAGFDSLALVLGRRMGGAADAAAYYLHPAIVDCSLHLGAVPAAPHSGLICRVPVGIRAYLAPVEKRQVQTGWAVAARPQAAGAATTSMRWRPGSSACAGCQLLGLHTRPMPLQQGHSNTPVIGVLGNTISRGTQAEARLLACTSFYAAHPVQLLPQPRGSLAALAAVPIPHGCPKDDQVMLTVAAVGLNFRDVLNVLGLYPGDPGAPGSDCAGRLATHMQPGTRVLVHAATGVAVALLLGMVAASLAALMHGGALVEVGKRGIWSPARVAQDRPDAAYHLVAIDFWRPATVAGSLLNLATKYAQGVQHLVLLGRNGRGAAEACDDGPHSWAAAVSREACDAAVIEDMCQASARSQAHGPEMTGLLHAGGALADATLRRLRPVDVRTVFAPKVSGAAAALSVCAGAPIGAATIFSSIAGALGSAGQAGYAGANAWLDARAAQMHAEGISTLSVDWGAWDSAGMAARAGLARMERLGIGAIAPVEGLAAMGRLLLSCRAGWPCSQVIACVVLWDRHQHAQSFYGDFRSSTLPQPAQEGPQSEATSRNAAFAKTSYDIAQRVVAAVHTVLGTDVGPEQPLVAAGLDSLGTVELRNELSRIFTIDLPGTLVYDHPTSSAIAALLTAQLLSAPELLAGDVARVSLVPCAAVSTHVICMGRIAARVADGHQRRVGCPFNMPLDAVGPVPLDRWDADAADSVDWGFGSLGGRFGGFVDGWADFDGRAFGIGRPEAAVMDPQQRLLLESAWELLSTDSSARLTAVAVGIARLGEAPVSAVKVSAFQGTGRALSAAAGRLSYTYDLKGPSVAIDTACSSSLVAVHFVRQSMQPGGCTAGVAAGVNLPMNWPTTVMFVAAGMTAPDGRCKALDAAADGYVRAEACICIALRSVDVAGSEVKREDNTLLAIAVRGSAVNQDGRSSSLTAPHGPSQQQVMRAAFREGCLDPVQAASLELHGTGTALGDPIELGAAAAVHCARASGAVPLELAAAKSRGGHAETGAGAVGMKAAAMRLSYLGQLPLAHLRSLNTHVAQALDTANAVQWMAPRGPGGGFAGGSVACVSAFAFQGTNAHAVLCRTAHVTRERGGCKEPCWRRQRLWYAPQPHGLLQRTLSASGSADILLEAALDQPVLSYLWDHKVAGRVLLPGAGMFEAALGACSALTDDSTAPALTHVSIPAALQLPAPEAGTPRLAVACATSSNAGRGGQVSVHSMAPHAAERTLHLQAICAWPGRHTPNANPDRSVFGHVKRSITALPALPAALAAVALPAGGRDEYLLHPAAMDASMHAGVLTAAPDGLLRVPGVPMHLSAAVGTTTSTYQISWQAHSALDVWQAELHQQQRDVWRRVCAGQAGGCTVSVLARRTASKASAAFQACQRGLRVLQMQGGLSGASVTVQLHTNSLLSKCSAELGRPACTSETVHALLRCAAAESDASVSAWQGPQAALAASTATAARVDSQHGAAGDANLLMVPLLLPMGRPVDPGPGALLWAGALLVAGGLGALGSLAAAWATECMAAKRTGCLMLTGRSGRASSSTPLLRLAAQPCLLSMARCDLGARGDLRFVASFCPRAYIHAGGMLGDAVLARQSAATLRAAMAPKLGGCTAIERSLQGCPLALSLLFSSLAALLGSAGQANYAAANAALDAEGTAHSASGLPVASLQWGPWAGAGMAVQDSGAAARLLRLGLHSMRPHIGLAALGSALSAVPHSQVVAHIDWRLALKPRQQSLHFFSAISQAQNSVNKQSQLAPASLPDTHAALHPEAVLMGLMQILEGMGAAPADSPPLLTTSALDSLGALELRDAIASQFAVTLPATAAYDYPDLRDLAAQIVAAVQPGPESGSMRALPASHRTSSDEHAWPRTNSTVDAVLRKCIADVLGITALASQPLMEAGLDSLGAVELRTAIGSAFGLELPSTFAFDYPTRAAMAAYVLQAIALRDVHPSQAAGALPGASLFWHNQVLGHDLAETVPYHRWDVDAAYAPNGGAGKAYVRCGAWLEGLEDFDQGVFGLAPGDAITLDPQARILLEQVQEVAGAPGEPLQQYRSSAGVYVGCMYSEFLDSVLEPLGVADSSASAITGHGLSFLAGRVSFTFGLQGPCVATDTACSSSLVALHLAAQAHTLRNSSL